MVALLRHAAHTLYTPDEPASLAAGAYILTAYVTQYGFNSTVRFDLESVFLTPPNDGLRCYSVLPVSVTVCSCFATHVLPSPATQCHKASARRFRDWRS